MLVWFKLNCFQCTLLHLAITYPRMCKLFGVKVVWLKSITPSPKIPPILLHNCSLFASSAIWNKWKHFTLIDRNCFDMLSDLLIKLHKSDQLPDKKCLNANIFPLHNPTHITYMLKYFFIQNVSHNITPCWMHWDWWHKMLPKILALNNGGSLKICSALAD